MAGASQPPRASVGVLTVDDHDGFRRAVRAVVEATPGFELLAEACSGDEALAIVGSVAPDLVLLDVRMPGLDGFETARRLRAAHPSAVVVLVSTQDVAVSESSSCGAAAVLPKSELCPAALHEVWEANGGAAARRGVS